MYKKTQSVDECGNNFCELLMKIVISLLVARVFFLPLRVLIPQLDNSDEWTF